MAFLTFSPDSAESQDRRRRRRRPRNAYPNLEKKTKKNQNLANQPSSWDQIKNMVTCKRIHGSKNSVANPISAYCNSNCKFRDVVPGNTRVVHRADNSPESSSAALSKKSRHGSARSGGSGASSYAGRGMQLRKLSGCYECHAIVDPSRYSLGRSSICVCSQCGEVFPKVESLQHHQAVRHAVSEMGPEDSSRNIVEIIFKSSWLKKDNPICKIERILKVHNTQRTIQRFEDYRDAVKTRANHTAKRDARCAADGNELLRFHCATLLCSLGAHRSSSLCGTIPGCGVCAIIRHGFQDGKASGIRTTASSGRAHDGLRGLETRRAMLVCRVIAGKVKRAVEDAAVSDDGAASPVVGGSFDSVAGSAGMYSNLEELYVFNPRAILPCFVVIYRALES